MPCGISPKCQMAKAVCCGFEVTTADPKNDMI
jgi:hypothetical protein